MKIAYYLNEGRKKNLYCRITDGSERITFSLDQTIDPKEWNERKEEINDEYVHHFTLSSLKHHLSKLYHQLKAENKEKILPMLKTEAESLMDGIGLKGIDRNLFNKENDQYGVPNYDDFIAAFEKYSGLTNDQYKVETLGSLLHIHTEDQVYEMDTYHGLTERIDSFIKERSYDEIYTMTDGRIWSTIYIDLGGIPKHEFIPVMYREWLRKWQDTYIEIKKEVGRTDHLLEQQTSSWRALQVFMECFEGAGDAIELAINVNDLELCPLAIITMMKHFDADDCYLQYCEEEFYSYGGWESISLRDEEDEYEDEEYDTPIFFIRPYEF
jgi:hypothetical protein